MMNSRVNAIALTCLLWAAAALQGADLPRKSPEFAIGMPGGKQAMLGAYKGKVVLLACILTTCPHCQHTTGLLVKMQNEFGPRGLQVLEAAIDADHAEARVVDFTRRFGTNFPVGFRSYDAVVQYLQHPPALLFHVPALVFIDRQGMIRAQYEGDNNFLAQDAQEKNIREQIEKLLKEPATPTSSKGPAKKPAASTPKKAT